MFNFTPDIFRFFFYVMIIFEKGDKVICVNDDSGCEKSMDISNDSVYIVHEFSLDSVCIMNDINRYRWYSSCRFILLSEWRDNTIDDIIK